ncbi:TonB-dependent receptor plug domain-containing protein, partial [Pseudomonas syringae]|nr:TonB-dependent receptor plug domain-containing protein [Pseudomonas syringae]
MLPAFRFSPLALLVAASLHAHADEPVALELNDVVVTASGFAQSVEDAPASVTVIDGETLRRKSYRDLGDAVRDVEGVTVNGGANETDISIRGMPADYTLIMVDGKRQSARESRVNGNSGYEQSFVPPAAAIERIEVVRGPMSSLYGSDAIGGVINVITRKVSPTWGGSIGLEKFGRHPRDQRLGLL